MERITISLPADVAAHLRREARRRHVAVSELVRTAVESQLGPQRGGRRIPFAAIGRSGRRDTSRRVDEILETESWVRARDR